MRDTLRAKPTKNAAAKSAKDLFKAYDSRSRKISGGKDPVKIQIAQSVPPTGQEIVEAFKTANTNPESVEVLKRLNPIQYAGNISDYSLKPDGKLDILHGTRGPATVLTNPNADEVYLAHELGHSASTNTKIGDTVRRMRDFTQANPATARSLALAGGLLPIAAGAITPGDEDIDEAILGSIALSAPTLADEFLASKNALGIMADAGRPATMGQKARLAGAYLSYLTAPIVTGIMGNTIGNQFDEDV